MSELLDAGVWRGWLDLWSQTFPAYKSTIKSWRRPLPAKDLLIKKKASSDGNLTLKSGNLKEVFSILLIHIYKWTLIYLYLWRQYERLYRKQTNETNISVSFRGLEKKRKKLSSNQITSHWKNGPTLRLSHLKKDIEAKEIQVNLKLKNCHLVTKKLLKLH